MKYFVTYLVLYIIVFYALSAIDFSKIIKKNSTTQAQILYIILSIVITGILIEIVFKLMSTFGGG